MPQLRGSGVALATIVCSYIFTGLASLSIFIHVSKRFQLLHRAALEDYLILLAFMFALALVGQTTWAVFDEGQGQHMSKVTPGHFEIIAKVRSTTKDFLPQIFSFL